MSEWSRVVKGGTKWRAKRRLISMRNELHLGAEGIGAICLLLSLFVLVDQVLYRRKSDLVGG